ncbi:hypothetical protein [Neisseria perflava]|uniref:hypothetical protein n=1 Tax=Neisseria perflava TaxID=33053 RepID=UPI0020A09784|nr:hypothetical protein [Neisseria perflava]MCP1660309.1 hypothetical protein [Neisseria perflava]
MQKASPKGFAFLFVKWFKLYLKITAYIGFVDFKYPISYNFIINFINKGRLKKTALPPE